MSLTFMLINFLVLFVFALPISTLADFCTGCPLGEEDRRVFRAGRTCSLSTSGGDAQDDMANIGFDRVPRLQEAHGHA